MIQYKTLPNHVTLACFIWAHAENNVTWSQKENQMKLWKSESKAIESMGTRM
jgi:hypothetical protein